MTAHQLRRIRRRLGLTQVEFAALVGLHPNTVARMERNGIGMKATTARLIQLVTATMKAKKESA